MRQASAALLLAATALAGCVSTAPLLDAPGYASLGFDGATWPDLHGAAVRVLAYEAFGYAFDEAQQRFKNLTNGTAILLAEQDSGRVLERAIRERGQPSFDVVYGLDNVLLGRAVREGALMPYTPLLHSRVNASFAFPTGGAATPVNHGYVAVNVDPRANLTVQTLDDVKAHARRFVTEDPRLSTPGLGFLLATVATYGEEGEGYDYLDYWRDLLAGGALVAPDWTVAYVNHFSGGYGQFQEGTQRDRAIVVSYSTSPAYEMYYAYGVLNEVVLAPKSTFHQVQTMGIAKGTRNLAPAQAWVEFALTDAFQGLAAPNEAIYPVVDGVDVKEVYQGRDPAPGSFSDTGFAAAHIDRNIERWLRAWTQVYEYARA